MLYDVQPAPRSAAATASSSVAPRLDNLASCHAAVSALLAPRPRARPRDARRRALRPRGGRQPSAQGAGRHVPASTSLERIGRRLQGRRAAGRSRARARARCWSRPTWRTPCTRTTPTSTSPATGRVLGARPGDQAQRQPVATRPTRSRPARFASLCAQRRRHAAALRHRAATMPCGSTIGPITRGARRHPHRRRRQPDAVDALVPRDGGRGRRRTDDPRAPAFLAGVHATGA